MCVEMSPGPVHSLNDYDYGNMKRFIAFHDNLTKLNL